MAAAAANPVPRMVGRLAGTLGGISMCTYRVTHRLHHNHLYGVQDPDIALNGGYPRGRPYLARKLLIDLTGWTAPKTYAYFFGAPAINSEADQALRPLNDTSEALRADADGVITAEGWGPITLAGNRVSMQDPSFVGESGLPLVSKKYYERVFVPASVLEETWRDPQAVRTSRPGHVEVAGGSLRVAGYQAHDPAFDFTNRVRRLFAERMQTSEEGEQFQSIYRQSSEGTMFSNSPGADAATIANDAARYDGWVCLLYTSPSPRD